MKINKKTVKDGTITREVIQLGLYVCTFMFGYRVALFDMQVVEESLLEIAFTSFLPVLLILLLGLLLLGVISVLEIYYEYK